MMETERGQNNSLSSVSTQSKIAQNSISDNVQAQADKETRENVQHASWDNYFLDQHDILKLIGTGNTPRTRVAILSGTDVYFKDNYTIETILSNETLKNKERWEKDIDKVNSFNSSPETNHMKFTVFDLGDYFRDFKNMTREDRRKCEKRILKDIKKVYPNVIVFPFCAAKFVNENNSLDIVKNIMRLDENNEKGTTLDGMDGMLGADILKLLRKKPSIWQEPLLVTKDCLLFKTKNIIQSNYTFLSSATRTTASGIEDSLPLLLDGIKCLGDPEYISILCISGTHGNLEGLSGFSDLSMLERKFYEETCKLLGIKPQVSKPDPKPQPLDDNADDEAILRDPLYRTMKFNALDIKHFHKDEKGLIEYVRAFGPNAIVLDWCFTKDGDVAKVLCKSGILSELWLKHERTSMVGITDGRWISLDQEQTQYLHEVSKRLRKNVVKHFVLYGGHGSGKTVLGVQTAKIVLGKLKEESPIGNGLFIVYAGSIVIETPPLLQNIEAMLKEEDCIKHYYPLKKLLEESGIEKEPNHWMLNDIILAIQTVFEKKYNDLRMNKIVLIDELAAGRLFAKDGNWCSLEDQFDKNESMYTITCVSPMGVKDYNITVKEKLEKLDEKSLLENQIMIRQLNVSYRNSSEIQFVYNVYQAHFNQLSKDKDFEILTGEMKQPEMDPNQSSNQDGETNLLPSGPKPTLLLSQKEFNKWSENDIKEIQENVFNLIDMNTNSFAAICYNKGKECRLCQKLNEEYQTKDGSTIKMGCIKIGDDWYNNVKGCEKDNLVIHYNGLFNSNIQFEFISRARKRLILIMDSKYLEIEFTFCKVMKQLRNHSETCQNDMCQEHEWDKKEVIEVVEIDNEDVFGRGDPKDSMQKNVLALTGLGDTWEGQGLTPIDTLVDFIASTGFIQTHYRAYKFEREKEKDDCPNGCYVYLHGGRYEGYFNTDMSGGRNMNSRAVCARLVDTN